MQTVIASLSLYTHVPYFAQRSAAESVKHNLARGKHALTFIFSTFHSCSVWISIGCIPQQSTNRSLRVHRRARPLPVHIFIAKIALVVVTAYLSNAQYKKKQQQSSANKLTRVGDSQTDDDVWHLIYGGRFCFGKMPAKLSKFSVPATCKEYVHPWTDSCISSTAGLGLHALQESLKIYTTIYFVCQVIYY